MRNVIFSIIAASFLSSILTALIINRSAIANAHSAAVVTDEDNGIVRIVIDGKDMLTVTGAGVAVNGMFNHAGIAAPAKPGKSP